MLKHILRRISIFILETWALLLPASYAKYVYKKATGRKLNLKDPKDYNEKVQWLKVYSDTSMWTKLADKYKVREYIEECGLEEILVKLYGVWERAEDIDFDKLPDKFVLKTNHGHGRNLFVRNKNQLNIEETREKFNDWIKEKYGLVSFEPHCWKIPRRIIAEEFLEDKLTSKISSSIVDYKFQCINGEPEYVTIMFDRAIAIKSCAFDMQWNSLRDHAAGYLANDYSDLITSKPERLDEMIKICRILSKPFVQVRVDLYEVDRKVYFGELTFTPGGGLGYFTPEYFLKIGEKMDLSKAKRRNKKFIIQTTI